MFAGFLFFNAGLAMGGIARVGQIQLLQTFVTLAVSALLLNENITGMTVLFARGRGAGRLVRAQGADRISRTGKRQADRPRQRENEDCQGPHDAAQNLQVGGHGFEGRLMSADSNTQWVRKHGFDAMTAQSRTILWTGRARRCICSPEQG